MKILFLLSSLGSGGAERVAITLCDAWAARGDEVILVPTFSGRGECFYRFSPLVRIVFLADLVLSQQKSFVNQFARLRMLRRVITTERPNVIVSFLSNVNLAAVVASAGLGTPVVVCERTDPFARQISPLLKLACRFTYPSADALIVQTHAVAAKYASSGRNFPHLRVIPNPISRQMQELQRHISIGGSKRLIAVGRLEEGKQFSLLIRVFSNLSSRHTNWSLRILGDGPLYTILQQQISSLGLNERVQLFGRIASIGEELVKADAFVMTSSYEGFPNSLLEAMAVGLPCVTFDCPSGPSEMSMEGKVAILLPLNDEQALELALQRLMLDVNLRQALGSSARASVIERFSLEKVLEQWDLLFKELQVLH